MLITYEATLLEKIKLTEDVFYLKFNYPETPDWTFLAGQYMIFHFPLAENGNSARRLYSIASSPNQKTSLDFIIEIVPGGLGSEAIKKMEPGEKIKLQGPAGIFTLKREEKRPVIFLATGTGIAPIYSMLLMILSTNYKLQATSYHLFWGLKYKKDIYLKKEFDKLALQNPDFEYKICLSREENVEDSNCLNGRVTNGMEKLFESYKLQATSFDFYLCGGQQVVESLRMHLAEKNIPKEQITFEKFTT